VTSGAAWRALNPERARAYARQYHSEHRDHRNRLQAASKARLLAADPERVLTARRRNTLRRLYGLTLEEHALMVASQGGRCRICRGDRKLNVDHDHITGRVRGLLCSPCNSKLGWLESHREGIEDYLVCPVA